MIVSTSDVLGSLLFVFFFQFNRIYHFKENAKYHNSPLCSITHCVLNSTPLYSTGGLLGSTYLLQQFSSSLEQNHVSVYLAMRDVPIVIKKIY